MTDERNLQNNPDAKNSTYDRLLQGELTPLSGKQWPKEVKDIATTINLLNIFPTDLGYIIGEYAEQLPRITIELIKGMLSKKPKPDNNFSNFNFHKLDPKTGEETPLDLREICKQFGKDCFKGANFSGSNLNKVDLSHFCLEKVNFTKANLQSAIFNHSAKNLGNPIINCQFPTANLQGARLPSIYIEDCNFSDADLSRTYLYSARLSKNILKNTKFDQSFLDIYTKFESDWRGKQKLSEASWQWIHFRLYDKSLELWISDHLRVTGNTYFGNRDFLRHISQLNDDQPKEKRVDDLVGKIMNEPETVGCQWQIQASQALKEEDPKKAYLAADYLSSQHDPFGNEYSVDHFLKYTGESLEKYFIKKGEQWNNKEEAKHRTPSDGSTTTTAQQIQTVGFSKEFQKESKGRNHSHNSSKKKEKEEIEMRVIPI